LRKTQAVSIAELFSKNANTEIPSIYGALTGQARNFLNNQPALDWPDRQPITTILAITSHFSLIALCPTWQIFPFVTKAT
jgi:hypothetical protein